MSVLVKKLIHQTTCSVLPAAGATTTILTFTNPGAKRTLFFTARCIAYGSGHGQVSGAAIAGGLSGASGAAFFLSGSTTSPVTTVSIISDDGGSISWGASIAGNDLVFTARNTAASDVFSASIVLTGLLVGNT